MHKLITFDAFHTLFKPRSIASLYAGVAREYGVSASEESIEREFPRALKWTRERYPSMMDRQRKMSTLEWWTFIVSRTLLNSGADDDKLSSHIDEITSRLVKAFTNSDAYISMPFAVETLDRLKKQTESVVGVVTNSDDRVHSILDGLGMKQHLDFVVVSAHVGFEKPHKEMWKAAWSRYQEIKHQQVEPHEHLHIGDDIDKDYHGSRSMGIDAVLYDPDRRCKEDIAMVHSLDQIS